ncbi:NAD-dependent dehydratase [Skermanella aerolata]|uniref:NAD-dependent dehydratase n=1 Tax=Skermanella aerolata TaxID=393310 RepID=A0A512E2Q9_9PROT|nr:SDR family oxidoreductase [Skermanella aerolata]KJB90251.1 hypothetical protein N826_36790 [Skermanella aerolata KACC 11604]GEO42987.1 NAD-dependent dehydratase [Skermanella aerolata]
MLTHHWPKATAPDRVVVLGARGFVGRTLLTALASAEIPSIGLSSADLDLAAPGAGEKLAGILRPTDTLVMLSALTPDKGRGAGTFMANLRMSEAVSDALQKVAPAHVVYMSSNAVYPVVCGPISEATPAEPLDLYGAMHLSRELMLKAATQAPLAVLRPIMIYGAGDTHNSYGPNRLRRAAHKDGKITLFGGGEEMRDHISVDDVVGLLLMTLLHRSAGTLNLATGRSISYLDLAYKIADQFSDPIDVVLTPRQSPINHQHYDIINLRRAFPAFVFETIDDGLAKAHREMLAEALPT